MGDGTLKTGGRLASTLMGGWIGGRWYSQNWWEVGLNIDGRLDWWEMVLSKLDGGWPQH